MTIADKRDNTHDIQPSIHAQDIVRAITDPQRTESYELTNHTILDDFILTDCDIKYPVHITNCIFRGAVDLSFVCFEHVLKLDGTTFEQEADFTSTDFHKDISLQKATFNNFVTFEASNVRGQAKFCEAKFAYAAKFISEEDKRADVQFDSMKVAGHIDFTKVVFDGRVDFVATHFNDHAEFTQAVFNYGRQPHDDVDLHINFSNMQVAVDALFDDVVFHGKIDFEAARIRGQLRFTRVKFMYNHQDVTDAHVSFDTMRVTGHAHFNEADFMGRVSFAGTYFDDDLDFTGTQFHYSGGEHYPHISFNRMSANADVLFEPEIFNNDDGDESSRAVIFKGTVSFTNAKIRGCLMLGGAQFHYSAKDQEPHIDFNSTQIFGHADFTKTIFNGNVNFVATRFEDDAEFMETIFNGANLSKENKLDYANLTTKDPAYPYYVKFISMHVNVDAIFDKAIFAGTVDFEAAHVHGQIRFYHTRFIYSGIKPASSDANGDEYEQWAEYEEEWHVNFDTIRVSGHAHFDDAHFMGRTSFAGTHFDDDVEFMGAQFTYISENASDDEPEPEPDVRFYRMHTLADVRFSEKPGDELLGKPEGNQTVLFAGVTDFSYAQFAGTADFQQVCFKDSVYFNTLTVGGDALFREAHFKGEATFKYARVDGYAIFDESKFEQLPSIEEIDERHTFEGMEVGRNAEFCEVTFGNHVVMRGMHVGESLMMAATQFKGKLDLSNVRIAQRWRLSDSTDAKDYATFAEPIDLRGTSYQQIVPYQLWSQIADKLQPYDSQPYAQFEKTLSRAGNDDEARKAYLRGQEERSQTITRNNTPILWFIDRVFYAGLAGYGVRSSGLIVTVLCIWMLSWWAFLSPQAVVMGTDNSVLVLDTWDAGLFALKHFLPIEIPVDEDWMPASNNALFGIGWLSSAVFATFTTILGWLLVPVAVASVSGILKRSDSADYM